MITAIIIIFVAILAVFLVALAWGANARKRSGQAEKTSSGAQEGPKIGRSTGPN